MGSILSSGFRATNFLPFLIGFFVRPESLFLRPDPQYCKAPARAGAVKVGRRTNLSTRSALARPYLDSSEHGGPLDGVGMTIRGEPAFECAYQSPTTLYSVGPRTQTMMQSCASAAKLQGGGPILFLGTKAMTQAGTPPPRTVIGDPSQTGGLGRNCPVSSATSVHCAGRRTMPSGTTPSRTSRHKAIRSLRAKATIIVLRVPRAFSVRARNHCAKALSFWNMRNRHANWIMPRRTRALPERASPFSRRFVPLSSGEPVRPA